VSWAGSGTLTIGYDVPDPGVGDMGVIRSIAASRSALVADIDGALSSVQTITGELPSQWSGSAADMNLNATLALVPDLNVLRASYEAHASALTTYAAEVDRIRIAAEPQIAAYNQALSDVMASRGQRNSIEGIGDTTPREYDPLSASLSGGYNEEDLQRAQLLDSYIEEGEQTAASARAALEALVADRAAADRACAAALSAESATGPFNSTRVDAFTTQEELLALLGTMSPTDAALFLNRNPHAVGVLADGNPDNAADVAALWLALGAGATEVARSNPDVVGNLEGASSWDRGTANQIVLTREIAAAEAGIERGGDREESYRDRLKTLQNVQTAVGDGLNATPPRTVHSLDLGEPVLASVVMGDLDEAAYASYNVPGMDTNVQKDMTNWTSASKGFYNEQVHLLMDDDMTKEEAMAQVAVVSWIGYETPNAITVSSNLKAELGAEKLRASIAGTNAQRDLHNPSGTLGIVAHSYGSTTAMYALSFDQNVDTLVTYGSAGQVEDLPSPVLKDGWYQTIADDDNIARFGQGYGSRGNPADDPTSAPLTAQSGYWENANGYRLPLVAAHGHSEYLNKGTASLHNMAAVTIGREDLASVEVKAHPRQPYDPTPPK
jgi:hypothetical protein